MQCSETAAAYQLLLIAESRAEHSRAASTPHTGLIVKPESSLPRLPPPSRSRSAASLAALRYCAALALRSPDSSAAAAALAASSWRPNACCRRCIAAPCTAPLHRVDAGWAPPTGPAWAQPRVCPERSWLASRPGVARRLARRG